MKLTLLITSIVSELRLDQLHQSLKTAIFTH